MRFERAARYQRLRGIRCYASQMERCSTLFIDAKMASASADALITFVAMPRRLKTCYVTRYA